MVGDWRQERIWVRRNSQGVLIEFSEDMPTEVRQALDARWVVAAENARKYLDRHPNAKSVARMLKEYESGSRTDYLLEALESLVERVST